MTNGTGSGGTAWSRRSRRVVLGGLALGAAGAALGRPARAQAKPIRIAVQFGIAYLPLIIADDKKFFAARMKEAGLGDTEVSLVRFSGAPAVSDAMLSKSVELGTYGVGGFLTIWDRTRGNLGVKGLCAVANMQSVLLTNRPDIHSLKDFKPTDRIAVPATVAPQAQVLRMAAQQAFGEDQFGRFDAQLAVMPNPEGMRALVSRAGIAGVVSSPPFDTMALQSEGIRRILTSDDVFGGPSTFIVLATTEGFARENPKATEAILKAVEDAMRFIRENRAEAAEAYLRSENAKMEKAFIEKLLADPNNTYSPEPLRVMKYVAFMRYTKALRNEPRDWKDLFLPLIADRAGS